MKDSKIKWIKIRKNAMPKEDGEYLVCYKKVIGFDDKEKPIFELCVVQDTFSNGKFDEWYIDYDDDCVTHWSYMPSPPIN